MSPRQIDRRLKGHKGQAKRQLCGRAEPGTLLRHHIPVKTEPGDVKTPAFVSLGHGIEIDR